MVDFLSEYHTPLWEVLDWPPGIVLALVEGLPDNKAYAAYLHGGEKWREFYGWGADRHLWANQWDLTVAVNTPKGKKAAKYPRPTKATQGVPLMARRPPRNIKRPE